MDAILDRPSAHEKSNLSNRGMHYSTATRPLGRLRYQLLIGVLVAVIFPTLIYHFGNLRAGMILPATQFTAIGATIAALVAISLFRRVISFPGVGVVSHVLPAVASGYGLVLVCYLGARLPYSGAMLLISFVGCTTLLFLVSFSLRSSVGRRFYVVPSPGTEVFPYSQSFEWVVLTKPVLPRDPHLVLIANLHAELGAEWEKLIADTAVAGYPVYHIKQVKESLTGRVEIEHLSENSFGSLIPNLSYRKVKRVADFVGALASLIPMLLVVVIVATLIKIDSRGPVFFYQKRRGYRNEVFKVVKFRTMTHRQVEPQQEREDAITKTSDIRITRLGQFLRRTRIDELPQIWNVLKGEMSWIGPRPEAMALSDWYAAELPFYHYRHIVRPGITGWAQVNQGHVADLDGVFEKLHYDFYYIKHFSAWLDLLILVRTVTTISSGFGAK